GLGIDRALDMINGFVGAVRSFVCLFAEDNLMESIYECCQAGVAQEVTHLQSMAKQGLLSWMGKGGKGVHISSAQSASIDIPADIPQQNGPVLSSRSRLAVPMTYAGRLMGYVGIEIPEQEYPWPPEMVTLLTMVGEIFINALVHQRTGQALQT